MEKGREAGREKREERSIGKRGRNVQDAEWKFGKSGIYSGTKNSSYYIVSHDYSSFFIYFFIFSFSLIFFSLFFLISSRGY